MSAPNNDVHLYQNNNAVHQLANALAAHIEAGLLTEAEIMAAIRIANLLVQERLAMKVQHERT